ncbi:MAG: hypothetical protein WDO16_06250 [Bacteroidota bacterium]
MKQPVINVIFRACDVVSAVNKQPRPFDLDKPSLIKLCFKSLYHSIQEVPHTITVLGDKLSEGMIDFFSGYNVHVSNGNYGNDASIRATIEKAVLFPDDEWIYFCEDDYLHRPETFCFIAELLAKKEDIHPGKRKWGFLSSVFYFSNPSLVVFPSDYPDRYQVKYRDQHFIFHTENCHWRQVTNTTFTFLMQVKDVKRYKPILLKASVKANDAYLSKKIFGKNNFTGKSLCVSPIPSLTAHMHINTLPPLIDWKSVAENIAGK